MRSHAPSLLSTSETRVRLDLISIQALRGMTIQVGKQICKLAYFYVALQMKTINLEKYETNSPYNACIVALPDSRSTKCRKIIY